MYNIYIVIKKAIFKRDSLFLCLIYLIIDFKRLVSIFMLLGIHFINGAKKWLKTAYFKRDRWRWERWHFRTRAMCYLKDTAKIRKKSDI